MAKLIRVCQCQRNGNNIDSLLQCAPCPPPMLSYKYFREYALNQSLCLDEICSIAQRCLAPVKEFVSDCLVEQGKNETSFAGNSTKVVILCVCFVCVVFAVSLICGVRWLLQNRKKKCRELSMRASTDEKETFAEPVSFTSLKEQASSDEKETVAELVSLTSIPKEQTSTGEKETVAFKDEEQASTFGEETGQESPQRESLTLTKSSSLVSIGRDNESVSESLKMRISRQSSRDSEAYYSANESDTRRHSSHDTKAYYSANESDSEISDADDYRECEL